MRGHVLEIQEPRTLSDIDVTELINKRPVIYTGVFFDEDTTESLRKLGENALPKKTERLHVTVMFRPKNVHEELFGSEVSVEVTGYGHNAENEGLSCKVSSENPELQKLLDGVEVPHITLAISKNGKAVNTRFVEFDKPVPFTCKGVFDGFRG